MNEDFLLSSYNYQLPSSSIAQNPAIPRDSSRLLVVNSPNEHIHCIFRQLPHCLLPGDLLVFNNTRVIPARLYGYKSTGATVEILLLEEKEKNLWLALVKPGKRFALGSEIIFTPHTKSSQPQIELKATVVDRDEATGGRILQFELPPQQSFWQVLEQFGEVPIPPYITNTQSDVSQYQTVFAQREGAVAAPTAGLHFTPQLLQKLQQQNIDRAYITLHVGIGTFRPVEADKILNHTMHQEWIDVSLDTVKKIEQTKARGGRVIAVGTTASRALEGAAKAAKLAGKNSLQPYTGKTDLFIYPGYQWQVIDGLITNFHLPGSSLLMMVSALIGRKRLLALYQDAIAHNYRFYSFGDAMLILPEAKLEQYSQT
ncbi:tRNA preQ1(34) S-adenosylmethionine ribosyltransferase-isomerase QueA [Myxosarcina sp. GI1]|uniref:tRNA preQ1(34) S-adenosylmethionine ribosyltransferase-isomerase QueA n=1 Tax=Myxosarcina sp. GI1 TaxID=1541065 RepID=UPI000565D870|nr:tRNA preQ1(34) S-adenosylmethionine ribosyltransferase-isomerase QueA [Myxosarcina sp. GI1]